MNTETLEEFRRHLRTIERGVESSLKSQTACCGVSLAQCHLIMELGEKGSSSLVDLATHLKLDASTLSRTADTLVKARLLSREVDAANRRYIRLSLTAKGREKWSFINKTCNTFYEALFDGFSKTQQKTLLEVIPVLAAFLDQSATLQQGGCSSVSRKEAKHGRV